MKKDLLVNTLFIVIYLLLGGLVLVFVPDVIDIIVEHGVSRGVAGTTVGAVAASLIVVCVYIIASITFKLPAVLAYANKTEVKVDKVIHDNVYTPGVDKTELTVKERMHKILEEGVKYYSTGGKRGVIDTPGSTGCSYKTKSGAMCFIGRLLSEDEHKEVVDKCLNTVSVGSLLDKLNAVPEVFKGIPRSFLGSCQGLHDAEDNWKKNGTGLTAGGVIVYNNICRRIDEGIFED